MVELDIYFASGCGRTNTSGNTMNSKPADERIETRLDEDDPVVPEMTAGGESDIKDKMKPKRDGLGKDIRAWRKRRALYKRPHPMEQRPIKPACIETFRVPISEGKDRQVVVRSFKGKIYVNIKDFSRHPVTQKWIPGKKGIDLSLEQWEALKDASQKIDGAIQKILKGNINSP